MEPSDLSPSVFLTMFDVFCCNLRKLIDNIVSYEIINMIKLMRTIFLILLILTFGGCGAMLTPSPSAYA